mmetsp:Transcript_44938/g.52661  ORF Transcript_44938/g.52661 Transcript_44938/m.52661 type:complete len:253 (-) Transcript_44938:244-1002(-)
MSLGAIFDSGGFVSGITTNSVPTLCKTDNTRLYDSSYTPAARTSATRGDSTPLVAKFKMQSKYASASEKPGTELNFSLNVNFCSSIHSSSVLKPPPFWLLIDPGFTFISLALALLIIASNIGRGTGHLASFSSPAAAVLTFTAGSSCNADELVESTLRRLALRASGDGHERLRSTRLTARLLTVFRTFVSDTLRLPSDSSIVTDPSSLVSPLLLIAYARESETSLGAMQKSISFTFPLLPIGNWGFSSISMA